MKTKTDMARIVFRYGGVFAALFFLFRRKAKVKTEK